MSDFISVSLLTGYIKNIMDSEEMLHNIKLVGEVSTIRCSGPHAYFTLKDENSQIDCNCFYYAKTYLPKTGESVCLYGSVDFYQKGGRLTFNAKKVEPLGQGLLALKLEELKQKLAKAGYFDDSHKKNIPKYPNNVCVLTAKTGAVIRDIVSTIRKKNNLLNIDVVDVKVQGNLAENTIITALDMVDGLGYDTIIIARGGGSMEDLMPFNSERLVYKIFDCKTPIISAVGHETDFTLCDFVADIRVPTPTAAGELVGFSVQDFKNAVIQYCLLMQKELQNRVDYLGNNLNNTVKMISSSLNLVIANNAGKIGRISTQMTSSLKMKYNDYEHKISALITKLESNNPVKILAQGYAKLYDDKGFATSIEKVKTDDDITVLTSGGKIVAQVKDIKRM